MALQLNGRTIVAVLVVVVIIVAAAAYLLTRDGGDEAQGYEVTIGEFSDAEHPDVTIEVTDADGNVVDGSVTVDGDAVFGVEITSDTKILHVTTNPSDRVTKTEYGETETDDGYVYTFDMTVRDGGDVTVTFDLAFSTEPESYGLELTPYVDTEGTGAQVIYMIGGEVVSGTVQFTQDTEVTIRVTAPMMIQNIEATWTPEGAAEVTGNIVTSAGTDGYYAEMVVTVKAGQDVTLTAVPEMYEGQVTPTSYIGVLAPEGVTVKYGESSFENRDMIPLTGDTTLTIDAGDSDVVYVLSWNGQPGTVTSGTTVEVEIPKGNSIGTLRIGIVEAGAESPEYKVRVDSPAGTDVTVDNSTDNTEFTFSDSEVLDLKVTAEQGRSLIGLYVFLAWEDGTSTTYTAQMDGSTTGVSVRINGLAWGHGNAIMSVIPVYSDVVTDNAVITVSMSSGTSVEYGGEVVGTSGITPVAGSEIRISAEERGELSYIFTWGTGENAVSLTGWSYGFSGQILGPSLSEILTKMGSGSLRVVFESA